MGVEIIVWVLESFGIEVVFGMCGYINFVMFNVLDKLFICFVGVRYE